MASAGAVGTPTCIGRTAPGSSVSGSAFALQRAPAGDRTAIGLRSDPGAGIYRAADWAWVAGAVKCSSRIAASASGCSSAGVWPQSGSQRR